MAKYHVWEDEAWPVLYLEGIDEASGVTKLRSVFEIPEDLVTELAQVRAREDELIEAIRTYLPEEEEL